MEPAEIDTKGLKTTNLTKALIQYKKRLKPKPWSRIWDTNLDFYNKNRTDLTKGLQGNQAKTETKTAIATLLTEKVRHNYQQSQKQTEENEANEGTNWAPAKPRTQRHQTSKLPPTPEALPAASTATWHLRRIPHLNDSRKITPTSKRKEAPTT